MRVTFRELSSGRIVDKKRYHIRNKRTATIKVKPIINDFSTIRESKFKI
jgi:hypothetical protein